MSINTSTQPLIDQQPTQERPKHARQAQEDLRAQEDLGSSVASSATNSAVPPTDSVDGSPDGDRSVSVWTMLLFIAGCAILVIAAWNLPNLARWGDDYGTVLVFLAFFMVMSIGGRWFWGGVDAIWSAVRGKDQP
ncbi:hypothetical protein [Gordonia humi]|uniref:Transmembrane protein n=1 Tax=Gordonia humi TaxID=686429 RepID=A0A840EUX9_9ACTN|nr:hypothetical protein [Gordonia humi]MBB4133646.1 hypothetical protein [Gordonia humi]